ncbi:MAG: CPBP family intramembrane metalloprotease [Candidatus Nomurabacteria bacterium]|jgi:membrane protease YdiL (CAAX protease family)|nr:CPBP family intramembrane metalloprotease [Candidatus Nomurabacteria bacterium]
MVKKKAVKKSAKSVDKSEFEVAWQYLDFEQIEDEQNAKSSLIDKIITTAGWILWIVIAYFVANFVMAIIMLILRHYQLIDLKNPDTITIGVINILMYIFLFIFAIFLPVWWSKRKRSGKLKFSDVLTQVGLSRPPKLIDLRYFAADLPVFYIVNIVISGVAAYILGSETMGQAQSLDFTATGNVWWQLAIIGFTYIVVAPVFEEMTMRGFLFGKLRKKLPFLTTAVLVSLLFAVAHGQINVGIMTFILSMFACYMREKTGSIWGGIFLHAFSNCVAFILVFLAS